MGIKQSLNKLLRLPISMRIDEVINIMAFLSYYVDRINGSHYVFIKKNERGISIPVSKGQVKRVYLQKIRKIYEDFNY